MRGAVLAGRTARRQFSYALGPNGSVVDVYARHRTTTFRDAGTRNFCRERRHTRDWSTRRTHILTRVSLPRELQRMTTATVSRSFKSCFLVHCFAVRFRAATATTIIIARRPKKEHTYFSIR